MYAPARLNFDTSGHRDGTALIPVGLCPDSDLISMPRIPSQFSL